MSFRFKSALAHLIALAAIGIGWFTYMPWAILRAAPLPEIASAGAGILLLGNGFLYLYLLSLFADAALSALHDPLRTEDVQIGAHAPSLAARGLLALRHRSREGA